MKRMSRRMKRLIAILVVEVLIAVNVLTAYANETGQQEVTISEAELASAYGDLNVTDQKSVVEATDAPTQAPTDVPTQEPTDAPTQEPTTEPVDNPTEEPAAEGAVEESPTPEAEVGSDGNEATDEVPEATPEVSSEETPTAEPSVSPSASPSASPNVEIVEEENTYVITGICEADGSEIGEEFTISVSDATDLDELAPEIDGYSYTGVASLEDGTQVTDLKKETVETETEEKILVETIISYQTGSAWVTVTEDMTITFEYEAEEADTDTEMEAEAVSFYVVCVDMDGNVIAGYEEKELPVDDTLDLTTAPIEIAGYEYQGAMIDDQAVISLDKNVEIDENNKEVVTYSYTSAATTYSSNSEGGTTEVSEDTTITLVYAAEEAEELDVTIKILDVDGNVIEGYAEETLPAFEESLTFDDAEKAPIAVKGYDYVLTVVTSASRDNSQNHKLESLSKKTVEGVTSYYMVSDGQESEVPEDAVLTMYYVQEEPVFIVKLEDENGKEIKKDAELPEFDNNEIKFVSDSNVIVEHIAVDGYKFKSAEIDGTEVKKLKRSSYTKNVANKGNAEIVSYAYVTKDGTEIAITEDTEVVFVYTSKSYEPGQSANFRSILGNAVNYGIVAREIATGNHMDTNFATILLNNAGQTTAGKYTGSHNPGDFIIAAYQGSGSFIQLMMLKQNSLLTFTEIKCFILTQLLRRHS